MQSASRVTTHRQSSPSRPVTAATALSLTSTAEDREMALYALKTRRGKAFLHDAEGPVDVLPQPLPRGIPYAAQFISFDDMRERHILQQAEAEQVHLSAEDVRLMYEAKCADKGIRPTWAREVRFMELLSAHCRGSFFCLREHGLGYSVAEAIARVLAVNEWYAFVDLSGNSFRDQGADSIAKLLQSNSTIVHLNLRSNDIGHTGGELLAAALNTNCTVTSLDLGGVSGINRNHLGSRGAAAIGNMLRVNDVLCTLNMSSNGIGAEGMYQLAGGMADNVALTHLDVSSNSLGPRGAEALAQVLDTTRLSRLDLRRNAIGDAGLRALVDVVVNQTLPIERLALHANALGPDSVAAIGQLLKHATALHELGLAENDLAGLGVVAAELRDNRALAKLDVSRCALTDADGAALGTAMGGNRHLAALDLSANRLADVGAKALAEALRANRTLRMLDVSANRMTRVGCEPLVLALRHNHALQELSLRHVGLTHDMGSLLCDELRLNHTLLKCDVSFNDVAHASLEGIRKLLARNNAHWVDEEVPRLKAQKDSLEMKQKELYQAQEDTDFERRAVKERADFLLRRKEEGRMHADRVRHEREDLLEKLTVAEEAAQKATERLYTEQDRQTQRRSQNDQRRVALERRIDHEREKRDRCAKEIDKLRRHIKQHSEAEQDALNPLLFESERAEDLRKREENSAKQIAESVALMELKIVKLEMELGLSTANVSDATKRRSTAKKGSKAAK